MTTALLCRVRPAQWWRACYGNAGTKQGCLPRHILWMSESEYGCKGEQNLVTLRDAECFLYMSGKQQGRRLSQSPNSQHSLPIQCCSHICRRPIGIPDFIQHFWWCFDRLKEYSHLHPGMPAYFRFMTILGEDKLFECTTQHAPAAMS